MYDLHKKYGILAIDYDDTYTVNPILFEKIASMFKSINWQVFIVTARADGDNDDMPEFENIDKVIYCNGVAKMDLVHADIWIDDNPLAITHSFTNAVATPNNYTQSWLKDNR